jgi:hypothetical protein
MTFHLRGEAKDPVGMGVVADGAQSGCCPGYEGRGGRAEPAAQWDVVLDFDGQGAIADGPLCSCYHTVALARRRPMQAVVLDTPSVSGAGMDDAPWAQSHGETVEGGAEIGGGGGG